MLFMVYDTILSSARHARCYLSADNGIRNTAAKLYLIFQAKPNSRRVQIYMLYTRFVICNEPFVMTVTGFQLIHHYVDVEH